MTEIIIPIQLRSEANRRDHWRVKQRRRKQQVDSVLTHLIWQKNLNKITRQSVVGHVHLIRRGPKLMDADNNAGSFKHVQDAIAEFAGVDDGDSRWTWEYGQEKAKEYSVAIRFGI